MRRAALAATAALAVATLALLAPAAGAKRVRVFAVGPKLDLSWVDTRAHFRDKLFALIDERRRTSAAPAIQEGAADAASHLLGPADPQRPVQTARDLVTLPEDLGLMAFLTGSQGAQARQASTAADAIVRVLSAYPAQTGYYAAKYPELARRPLPTRTLALALTDTFGRVAVETFAELARTYKVWLVAGVNMAQDWQVVCTSRAAYTAPPGAGPCVEENAGKVALLRSPDEPARTYAYEASTAKASNMALVFDPAGKLVSRQIKTYLTPIELPGQLDLLPGEVFTGLSALRTPVGTLGFVTSKDAWMPDVLARLDQQRVELLVQPEFFVGNTVSAQGLWNADLIKGSGFSAMLRGPSFEAMVLPSMTGNLYELSADVQQHVGVKPRSTRHAPVGFLVGQPSTPGLARVGEWLTEDPATPGETIEARRARLGKAGDRATPVPGNPACPSPRTRGACRGGQVEDVIFQDVSVAQPRSLERRPRRKRGRTPFSVNRPIAPSANVQRNVALAARGRRVAAAFEERRDGRDQLVVTTSADGGARWSRASHPTGRSGATEWWPAVAVGADGTVWLAWSDDSAVPDRQRVYVARSVDGGRTFSAPVAADAGAGPAVQQMRPAIAATGPGKALVAFVDDRLRFTVDDLPQAAIWSVRFDGDAPQPAVRLDGTAAPAADAATLAHAWAPSLSAVGGRVLAAWVDFHTYDWRPYTRESADGGATWGATRALVQRPAEQEDFADAPRTALTAAGPLVAWSDWLLTDASLRTPGSLYDVVAAAPGAAPRQIDRPGTPPAAARGGAPVSAFAPALVAVPGGAVAAWQDHGSGPADVFAARLSGGRWRAPVRVDDSARAGWNQWRPALAYAGGRVLAAWEDERDGPAQVFAARAAPRVIG